MGIVSGIQSMFSRPSTEQRSYQVLIDALTGGQTSAAGVVVNTETSLAVPAVYACVRVIAETMAQLPCITYRRLTDNARERATDSPIYRVLRTRPNRWQTAAEFFDQMMTYTLLRGNGIAEIRVIGGELELWPIHPSLVSSIERNNRGTIVYKVRTEEGTPQRTLTQDEVIHVRGPSLDGIVGMSPISYARDTIGSAIATIRHSGNVWRRGGSARDILETDQQLSPNVAERTREQWQNLYSGVENAGRTAVLEQGLKVHRLTISHADMQFIEQQRYTVEDIARLFRVPLHMVGDLTHATFSNIEHQQLAFISHTMGPWFARWEQAIQRDLIDDDDYFVEFLADGLLRGDVAARTQHYREMFQLGALSVNEIRAKENMNPISEEDGGDKRFVNAAMIDLKHAGEMPEQQTQPGKPVGSDPVDGDPEDPADDLQSDAQRAAAQALWDGERRKLTRWIADELVRAAKEPYKFLAKMEAFLESHEARTAQALLPAETVCRACGIDVRADATATEQREAVWKMVLEVAESTPAELMGRASLVAEGLRK